MKKKLILSAGGTGGHLFPAQSLALEFPDWEILFVAGGLSSNRYFDRQQFLFEEVESATFSLSKPLQVLKGCRKIYRGVSQSRKVLRRFAPELIIGFGSFFTLPILIAAFLEKIPFILHEQNTVPGKVNRLFSSFAKTTTITFPMTRNFLRGRASKQAVEVVFPLRKKEQLSEEEMWDYFGLSPKNSVSTLLVFGGSQGAIRLNLLFLEALPSLSSIQVLHFTGSETRAKEARVHYERLQINACVKAFEPRMDLAMQIADFAVTRAGAATIAELIEYELPALLIPFPQATENHQEKNGSHFVSIVKGGKMYKESELNASLLTHTIMQQLSVLDSMKINIATYKEQRGAKQLADLIRSTL